LTTGRQSRTTLPLHLLFRLPLDVYLTKHVHPHARTHVRMHEHTQPGKVPFVPCPPSSDRDLLVLT
jgi:hypothetical protein